MESHVQGLDLAIERDEMLLRMFPDLMQRMYYFGSMFFYVHGLGSWCFDMTGQLRGSTNDQMKAFLDLFRMSGCLEELIEQAPKNKGVQVITDPLELVWLAEYEPKNQLIFICGPLFADSTSIRQIEQAFHRLHVSGALLDGLKTTMKAVPIRSFPTILHYAGMLHFAMFAEKLTNENVHYISVKQAIASTDTPVFQLRPGAHEDLLAMENAILQVVRSGNIHGREIVEQAMSRVTHLAGGTGDPLRDGKNLLIVFASQCARAAIEGGLSTKISLELNDYYIDQIERCRHPSDLLHINGTMLSDFTNRVHACKSNPEYSRAVQECCAYIQSHLREPIELKQLAVATGYTEYYLSRKFHDETGVRLNDYIRNARIDLAKVLLLTNRTTEQVSDELQFSARSYFCKVFKETTGMSPAQYRTSKLKGETQQ